jgi:hypothetical protein
LLIFESAWVEAALGIKREDGKRASHDPYRISGHKLDDHIDHVLLIDPGAREADAPLQVGASPASFRFGPRSGRQSVHALPLHTDAKQKRTPRTQAFETWESVTGAPMLERPVK